ncbi:MAG: sulfotransferase [Opitutales bacterium]|nr:sulfotransferase [Opitutales bacterium]
MKSIVKKAAPILVTGSHRSGSTWVGEVLASAPGVFYVHEPLNPTFSPHYLGAEGLPYFYQISPSDEEVFHTAFDRLLSGRFPRLDTHFFRPERRYATRYLHAVTFRWAALRRKRILLKDPFALFNVRWIERHYATRTVLLLRHPCAFVASLKVKNWTFDFRQWTEQPTLLEGPLASFRPQIEAAALQPPDIVEQGCLLWNCLTRETLALSKDNPEQRLLRRHEDLCTDPETAFRKLFHELDLAWTPSTQRFLLREAVSSGRPRENLLTSWKQRLDATEIRRVQTATAPLAESLYPA